MEVSMNNRFVFVYGYFAIAGLIAVAYLTARAWGYIPTHHASLGPVEPLDVAAGIAVLACLLASADSLAHAIRRPEN
jgi:hypothetical protein